MNVDKTLNSWYFPVKTVLIDSALDPVRLWAQMYLPSVRQRPLNHHVHYWVGDGLRNQKLQVTAFKQHAEVWTIKGGGISLSNMHFRKMRQRYVATASWRGKTHVADWVQRWKTTNSAEIFGKDSPFLSNVQAHVDSDLKYQFCSNQETPSVRAGVR